MSDLLNPQKRIVSHAKTSMSERTSSVMGLDTVGQTCWVSDFLCVLSELFLRLLEFLI